MKTMAEPSGFPYNSHTLPTRAEGLSPTEFHPPAIELLRWNLELQGVRRDKILIVGRRKMIRLILTVIFLCVSAHAKYELDVSKKSEDYKIKHHGLGALKSKYYFTIKAMEKKLITAHYHCLFFQHTCLAMNFYLKNKQVFQLMFPEKLKRLRSSFSMLMEQILQTDLMRVL